MSSLVIADEGELIALYGIRVCMCVTVALYGIATCMHVCDCTLYSAVRYSLDNL